MSIKAEHLKKHLKGLQESVKTAIANLVKGKQIQLDTSIIIAEHGDMNECVIGMKSDMTLITDFNYDEGEMDLENLPLNLQIALLEELEKGKFEVDFDEEETEE